MNAAVTAYIWYLVVAGPGGGMVVMPTGFDARERGRILRLHGHRGLGTGLGLVRGHLGRTLERERKSISSERQT